MIENIQKLSDEMTSEQLIKFIHDIRAEFELEFWYISVQWFFYFEVPEENQERLIQLLQINIKNINDGN